MCFLLFFCVVENSHFCRCRNANANILQKSLTFLCLLGTQFEEPSRQCSQLIDKAKFARLRKLKFFKKQWVLCGHIWPLGTQRFNILRCIELSPV